MNHRNTPKTFTGWHMTVILVAFFAVIMLVNFTMARIALSSFGGTVVDNSYVASQHYNEWLARADAQDRLGWERSITLDSGRHVELAISRDGQVLEALNATATVSHPLGRTPTRALRFEAASDGALRSVEALPQGRWRIDVAVRYKQDEARYRVDLQ